MSRRFKLLVVCLTAIVFVVSSWEVISQDTGETNLYTHQAQAFLRGRLDIEAPVYDVATFQSKHYVVFPPFPALLLLPFVAFLGVAGTRVIPISILISLVNVVSLTQILEKLEVSLKHIPWIIAALFWGTAYWSAVQSSNSVYYFAHVVSVGCMLLAINTALDGAGILAGLFLGMAFLTRQLSILNAIFVIAVLCENQRLTNPRSRVMNLVGCVLGIGVCVGIYLTFNWLRFGNMIDTGYAYIPVYGVLGERIERYGLFNLAYVPFNFVYMFLQGFHVQYGSPTFLIPAEVDPFGTSLTFASPFVFAALWAKWHKSLLWAAWVSVGLVLASLMFYYNNGSLQWNAQRFSLDLMPVLILLVALGMKQTASQVWNVLIAYSVLLNGWVVFYLKNLPTQ